MNTGFTDNRSEKMQNAVDQNARFDFSPAPPKKRGSQKQRAAKRMTMQIVAQSRIESPTESSKKIEKTVDGKKIEARVTLPQVTADSQDSEWFCEHREGKCLEGDESR